MPHYKQGELVLSVKEKKFYERYLLTGNATKSAITAGYSAKSAHVTGHRLKRFLERGAPIEAWKRTLKAFGWDYRRVVALWDSVERDGSPKELLNLSRTALASMGVPTSSESATRSQVNVLAQGPSLMMIGGDFETELAIQKIRKGQAREQESPTTPEDEEAIRQRWEQEKELAKSYPASALVIGGVPKKPTQSQKEPGYTDK